MHGLLFDIGLGCGLAAACGLRPFLPLLLAGALASGGALDVSFSRAPYRFLEAGWWLILVAAMLALAYLAQLALSRAGAEAGPAAGGRPAADASGRSAAAALSAALSGLALGAGAVVFAGTLAAHRDSWWPGLLGGILAAGLAQAVVGPVIAGARRRLPDRVARDALTLYLDGAALLCAALVAALHPLGYVLLAALLWFGARRRTRAGEKYAGLRILRR